MPHSIMPASPLSLSHLDQGRGVVIEIEVEGGMGVWAGRAGGPGSVGSEWTLI
jgi:hypothetical protein